MRSAFCPASSPSFHNHFLNLWGRFRALFPHLYFIPLFNNTWSCPNYSNVLLLFFPLSPSPGLRTVDPDGHPGDAVGGLRDGPRVHVRDAEAAADDHVGGGQGADPDVPELTGSAERSTDGRPAHECDRVRGDGAELQHRRRGLQSKAIGVRPSWARAFRASTGGGRRSLWPGPKPDATDVWWRWRGRRPIVTIVASAAVCDPWTLASFAHTAPACDPHDTRATVKEEHSIDWEIILGEIIKEKRRCAECVVGGWCEWIYGLHGSLADEEEDGSSANGSLLAVALL